MELKFAEREITTRVAQRACWGTLVFCAEACVSRQQLTPQGEYGYNVEY